MTFQFTVKSEAKEVGQYNREMSVLHAAFEGAAEKLGGVVSIVGSAEKSKPVLRVDFNDLASADAFEAVINTLKPHLPPLTFTGKIVL